MLKWEKVKDRVCARFVNTKYEKAELQDMPCQKFLDLTVVFYLEIPTMKGLKRGFSIDHNLMKALGQDVDGLFTQAVRNIKAEEMVILPLGEAADMSEELSEVVGIYVMTSRDCLLGTTLILSQQVREKIVACFGEEVYLLPSSRHEFILVPVSEMIGTIKELSQMVREINQSLQANDILGDTIYLLDMDGNISIAG